tara:strand:- start:225 stop:1442 length:1218 start_codon:yes stop_codon:yes gene_type:complete
VNKENLETKNNIQKKYLNKYSLKKMFKNFDKLEKDIKSRTNNLNQNLNILSKNYKFNFKTRDLNKFNKFKKIAILGMGGSILGSESIQNFLGAKIKKKIFFFDNLNTKKNFTFKKKENFKKILFIIISKSGNTVETLSNFLSLNIIKKKAKNIIIISEKENNPLYLISKKFDLFHVEHKKNIGGRYSVLSEVGIIPAYLMGLNIIKLRSNTLDFFKGKKNLFLKDSVVKLANLLKYKKIKNIIFLNYAPELEKFLFWCQQLIAESLGKNSKGFLPVISSMPKDHHSLLQLYLDGPRDKLFHIFSIDGSTSEKIQANTVLGKSHFLNKKNLDVIKNAQKNALIKTLKNKNIPFREFKIKRINESVLGELFSYFIIETVIIGKLIKINPYDQPAVEQIKLITKKLLS